MVQVPRLDRWFRNGLIVDDWLGIYAEPVLCCLDDGMKGMTEGWFLHGGRLFVDNLSRVECLCRGRQSLLV